MGSCCMCTLRCLANNFTSQIHEHFVVLLEKNLVPCVAARLARPLDLNIITIHGHGPSWASSCASRSPICGTEYRASRKPHILHSGHLKRLHQVPVFQLSGMSSLHILVFQKRLCRQT